MGCPCGGFRSHTVPTGAKYLEYLLPTMPNLTVFFMDVTDLKVEQTKCPEF